jgi:GNAT superfamily N-acetyltransferase
MIRPARQSDRAAVEAVVRAAYSIYIERLGKPPGPMLDDYERRIAENAVHVLETDGAIAAIIVLLPQPGALLLDNIAVSPAWQRRGLGGGLIAFAEAETLRLGFAELRLYTHAAMTENIALYSRLGFAETGRACQAGYHRVFMCKLLRQEQAPCR